MTKIFTYLLKQQMLADAADARLLCRQLSTMPYAMD